MRSHGKVWPPPKSLPLPSVRASLGEQEAAILWNKFPLIWACWSVAPVGPSSTLCEISPLYPSHSDMRLWRFGFAARDAIFLLVDRAPYIKRVDGVFFEDSEKKKPRNDGLDALLPALPLKRCRRRESQEKAHVL
ncbi:hypothetical protein SKAU_G00145370 [Synaphobranchus kaupii]|uniref:Uncharacterized protein n=1 Tax=Synaphobranchus kaupii TaxID=118154 RepID=A0A9Q1J4E0_SYNKA|nr:hypothetical protein SKAU_G00145370 [Synaphobranchus kaupii]